MKIFVTGIVLALISFSVFSIESDKQIEKAMQEYKDDNTSSAIRRLQVVIENDVENYKARWLYLHYTLLDFNTTDVYKFRSIAPEIKTITKLANAKGDSAYAHYVQSVYARNHRAYEIAIMEINKSLEIEPNSVLYNWVKAALLVRTGSWKRNNAMIYEGIDSYKKAHQLAGDQHPIYFTEVDYNFKVAWSLGQLTGGASCPANAIDHYLAVTQLSPKEDQTVAYAWNNISCAYRKLGQCEKAKEASQNALNIMKFGAAKTNLQYSEFCIQMQNSGLWIKMDDSDQIISGETEIKGAGE